MPVLGGAGGAALIERGTWASSTSYIAGNVVSWQGIRHVAILPHTSTANFDASQFVPVGHKPLGAIGAMTGQFIFYGNSYVATPVGYPTKIYPRLLIGADPTSLLRGVSGTTMGEVAWNMAKTAPADAGVTYIDGVINDVTGALTTQRTAAFTNGVRAVIDFAIAGAAAHRILHTDAGMVFTGTWTTPTMPTGLNSRTYRQTVTQNDSFTVTWAGDKVSLMLIGVDDTATTPLGATFSVMQGATTITTGTLSNQAKDGNSEAYGGAVRVAHCPVRLSGFGAGSHTVTVTKTDATGTALGVDCAVVPLASPPQVVITKGVRPATDGLRGPYAQYISDYNAIVDTEAASSFLPAGVVTVIDPAAGNSWSPNIHTDTSGLHLSPAGHYIFAGAIVERLTSLPFRPGFTTPSFLDLNPAANP